MSDVLKIALDRRAGLHEEVARLDEFIRTAEILLDRLCPRGVRPERVAREPGLPREVRDAFRDLPTVKPSEVATGKARGVSAGITRMNLMRRRPGSVNG